MTISTKPVSSDLQQSTSQLEHNAAVSGKIRKCFSLWPNNDLLCFVSILFKGIFWFKFNPWSNKHRETVLDSLLRDQVSRPLINGVLSTSETTA